MSVDATKPIRISTTRQEVSLYGKHDLNACRLHSVHGFQRVFMYQEVCRAKNWLSRPELYWFSVEDGKIQSDRFGECAMIENF